MKEITVGIPEEGQVKQLIPAVELRDITPTPALLSYMEMMGQQGKDITFLINSNGGNLSDIFRLRDEIDRVRGAYGVKLRTIVIGKAFSAAAHLASWGDERLAYPSAQFYLHNIQVAFDWENKNKMKDLGMIRKDVADTAREQRVLDRWLRQATRKKPAELKKYYDRHLSAHEALEAGLIDKIVVFDHERTR